MTANIRGYWWTMSQMGYANKFPSGLGVDWVDSPLNYTCYVVGLMLGPSLGGLLYDAAGLALPFLVFGAGAEIYYHTPSATLSTNTRGCLPSLFVIINTCKASIIVLISPGTLGNILVKYDGK